MASALQSRVVTRPRCTRCLAYAEEAQRCRSRAHRRVRCLHAPCRMGSTPQCASKAQAITSPAASNRCRPQVSRCSNYREPSQQNKIDAIPAVTAWGAIPPTTRACQPIKPRYCSLSLQKASPYWRRTIKVFRRQPLWGFSRSASQPCPRVYSVRKNIRLSASKAEAVYQSMTMSADVGGGSTHVCFRDITTAANRRPLFGIRCRYLTIVLKNIRSSAASCRMPSSLARDRAVRPTCTGHAQSSK